MIDAIISLVNEYVNTLLEERNIKSTDSVCVYVCLWIDILCVVSFYTGMHWMLSVFCFGTHTHTHTHKDIYMYLSSLLLVQREKSKYLN